MKKKNIHYVFDEEWDEQEKDLKQILHEIDDPIVHKNIFVLESAMRAAACTFIKTPLQLPRQKQSWFQKVMNIPVGSEIQPIPIPSTETKPQPVQEFKEVQKFVQKTVIEPKQ